MTFTPMPMPIFINSSSEEEVCPSCGKPEDIKMVCNHCGYEYKPESSRVPTWLFVLLMILSIVIGAILLISGMLILFNWIDGTPLTKAIFNYYNDFIKFITNI